MTLHKESYINDDGDLTPFGWACWALLGDATFPVPIPLERLITRIEWAIDEYQKETQRRDKNDCGKGDASNGSQDGSEKGRAEGAV